MDGWVDFGISRDARVLCEFLFDRQPNKGSERREGKVAFFVMMRTDEYIRLQQTGDRTREADNGELEEEDDRLYDHRLGDNR